MKTLTLIIVAVATLTTSVRVLAVDARPESAAQAKPQKETKAGLQQRILEQFDANGNGKLEPDEQAAARKAAAERRKSKKKGAQDAAAQGFDPGNGINGLNGQQVGGGPVGPTGDGQAKLKQKFDFNRDGILSPQEMAQAQEWMRKSGGPGFGAGKLPPGFKPQPRPQN